MEHHALEVHSFTRSFWPEHQARLAAMASDAHFESGEFLFREGDHSSFFYLLVSGSVALEVVTPGRPVRVATLYAGDALGWSSIGHDDTKQFQARALEPVQAIAFDGARLMHACEQDYAFGFALMRAMNGLLSTRLHSVRAQLIDLFTPVGTQ
jgi:CRP-like cAMP-binding protein